ncbi:MAG: prephenate dehydratase domain-containing protein [Polyangiaceae bacterium]
MTDRKRDTDDVERLLEAADLEILVALEKRARLAKQAGERKKIESSPTLPQGERARLDALLARAQGDLPEGDARAIFQQIYASCAPLEVARAVYVGPEGGVGHIAARMRFGASSAFVSSENAAAAIEEVVRQRADFAVVPLETKSMGPVQATIEALRSSDLKIVGSIEVSISLDLMNRTGNAADIEKVYAAPGDRALAQRALGAPGGTQGGTSIAPPSSSRSPLQVLEVKTPLVACQFAKEDHGAAALVAESVGAAAGLLVARRSIGDISDDRVRYAVIGSRPPTRTGEDATALVFSVEDSPGALLQVLSQFSERGINVIKIHSHPVPGAGWSYLFFVEVWGHASDRSLVTAFDEVRRRTKLFKVLGSYAAH